MYRYTPGALLGRDGFTGIAAGTALNGRAAPAGGTWATSGAATDFAASDGSFVFGSSEEVGRSTTGDTGSGRFAILGATAFTDVEVGVSVCQRGVFASAVSQALVARWVDASNWLEAVIDGAAHEFRLAVIVAGVRTTLKAQAFTPDVVTPGVYGLRIVCFASGRVIASLLDSNGGTLQALDTFHSSLAPGGALASGKPGFRDANASAGASTRSYDNFYVASPSQEPIALYAGRRMEFRHDGQLRESADGTTWGPPPLATGGNFYLPPAGDKGRVARLVAKADRNDLETTADVPLGDVLQMQIVYTPRDLYAPRP